MLIVVDSTSLGNFVKETANFVSTLLDTLTPDDKIAVIYVRQHRPTDTVSKLTTSFTTDKVAELS